MLSNFHKITSEHWQRTPGTQKGSPFSSKRSRAKYKRQRDKIVRDGDHPGEGVVKKFPNTRKPSHQRVCREFWNLRGQHKREGKNKNKTPQNMHLALTPSGEIAQKLASATSKRGLKMEAWVVCLG